MGFQDYDIIASFRGGSLARTMLIRQNGEMKIRKEADSALSPYAFQKLHEQYAWLEAHQTLCPKIPKIIGKHTDGNLFAVDLEYYPSTGFFEFIHSKPMKSSKNILSGLVDFCFDSLYAKGKRTSEGNDKKLEQVLKSKLTAKVQDALDFDRRLKEFSEFETIAINNKEFLNYHKISEKILKDKETMKSLASTPCADIHGDPTVDNVICMDTEKGEDFVLLDPNPDNILNTPLVDMAKISQSLNSGFEFLISLEDCQVYENQVIYNSNTSVNYKLLNDFFMLKMKDRLSDDERDNLLFFEALNYSRALPIRQKIDAKTSFVYYATLVKLLNDFAERKGLV